MALGLASVRRPPSRLGHSQANLDGARCSVGWSASRVYGTLRSTGLLAGYIIPCYDVLHTFSKEYMVEDLTQARPRSTSGRLLPKGRKKVKLYHASTIRVEHPDVQHSRPNLDFGGASLPW